MAKAKAKWLEESTNRELLEIVKAGLNGEDAKKGLKAVDELIERTPDTDGEVTVEEALEALDAATANVKVAYQAELAAMEGEDPDAEDEEDDSDEDDLSAMSKKDLVAKAKELGIKGAKKKEKDELIQLIQEAEGDSDEDSDEDDEEGTDYSEMSKKELLAECKERGLKANKKMSQEELIAALEADDEE